MSDTLEQPQRFSPASPTLARMYRIADVQKMTCLSVPSIYRKMADGTFPRPVKIGARAVAWKADAIEAWIAALPVGSYGRQS